MQSPSVSGRRKPVARLKAHTLGTLLMALVLSATACGGGGSSSATEPAPTAATVLAPLRGSVVTLSIDSVKVGATYPINIYTPADYATTNDRLPVVYALDGGNDSAPKFETMASILEQQGVRAILIGIGNRARRQTDYRMPGATDFQAFVTTELIAWVEPKYRIDASARTLVGHSYGGLFVYLELLMERPNEKFFNNFIALDGSFWYQPEVLGDMEKALYLASGAKLPNTRLILTGALQSSGNDAFVELTYQKLLARQYQGLNMQRLPAYDLSHNEMFAPAFADSIRTLFEK